MTSDVIDQIVEQWEQARPDVDVSPTHVLQRITRLYLLQSASFAEVFARHGLTFADYEVLAALVRSGPPHRMKPTDLGQAIVLSSGAMTNRIDRLEKAGFVQRLPDPDDRRGTLVALTADGRRATDKALLAHVANEDRLLGALSARERDQLAALLRKLLLSEPFAALDPAHAGDAPAPAAAPRAQARRPRRR